MVRRRLIFTPIPSPLPTTRAPLTGTVVITYTSDPLYRLTAAEYNNGMTYQYQYGAVGNTLAYTQTLAAMTTVTTYTFDAANQLVTAHADGAPITWHDIFDANGSLTEITPNGTSPATGARRYTYSAAGYLLQVETHDGTAYQSQAEMVYNGLGQRLSLTAHQGELSLTTQYLLDYPAHARPLAATANSQTTSYLYGNGPIAELKADWTYYLSDGTGTVRQLTNRRSHPGAQLHALGRTPGTKRRRGFHRRLFEPRLLWRPAGCGDRADLCGRRAVWSLS